MKRYQFMYPDKGGKQVNFRGTEQKEAKINTGVINFPILFKIKDKIFIVHILFNI